MFKGDFQILGSEMQSFFENLIIGFKIVLFVFLYSIKMMFQVNTSIGVRFETIILIICFYSQVCRIYFGTNINSANMSHTNKK